MKISVLLGRVWRNVNRRVSRFYIRGRIDDGATPLERLGSPAGGWRVPADAPEAAVAYCGGVGVDATFDFALKKKGLDVHSFDPTPRAIAYMERENTVGVTFHPWGLIDEDRVIRFYAPLDSRHQSWFAENLHGTDEYFDAQCYKISSIMARLGHDDLYLLKIDIEGSWYKVILDMLSDGVRPVVLDVEFDSPAPVWRVFKVTRALERAGYTVAAQEKDNVTFLRSAAA